MNLDKLAEGLEDIADSLEGRRKKKSKLRKRVEKTTDAIRYAYWSAVPHAYRPHQLWYKFKCWGWHRYSTIKCRYLPHTWCDRTDVLPHTMFEILSRFIEGECSPGHIDWERSNHTVTVNGVDKNVRAEMQDLYDWWHQVYQKEYKEVEEMLWKEAHKHPPDDREFIPINADDEEVDEDDADFFRWEQNFETEDDEEIHRICIMAVNKLEQMQKDDLQKRMHRLVELTPYLWT